MISVVEHDRIDVDPIHPWPPTRHRDTPHTHPATDNRLSNRRPYIFMHDGAIGHSAQCRLTSDSKSREFQDSRISGKMIHPGMELLPSLLSGLKAVCAAFPDPRKGRGGNISMAILGCRPSRCSSCRVRLSSPSSGRWRKARAVRTARACSASRKIPSDNYIRDMLDGADPLAKICVEGRSFSKAEGSRWRSNASTARIGAKSTCRQPI